MHRHRIHTRHPQNGLLLVSLTWGLGYLMPKEGRLKFSEVFPGVIYHSGLGQMWAWGLALLVPSILALVAGLIVYKARGQGWVRSAWKVVNSCHTVLAAVFFTLAFTAFVQALYGLQNENPMTLRFWEMATSGLSRPVLWGYIGYLHSTYARLSGREEDDSE